MRKAFWKVLASWNYLCGMNTREQHLEAFGRLLDIMDDLREKCPWDRKQTFESLRHLTIEEAIRAGGCHLGQGRR